MEFADGRIVAYDKKNRTARMQHIDYGLGVFRAAAFAGQHADLADVYRGLLHLGELAAFEVHERFYEIGSFEGIRGAIQLSEHMSFTEEYIAESAEVLRRLDPAVIEKLVQLLAATRARGGRLFILGVGGSAANASHAVNDFRKICGMEAYCPTDNVSELDGAHQR